MTRRVVPALCALALTAGCQGAPPPVDWPVYGGDQGATKYSPLEDIDRASVSRLAVAWQWRPGEEPREDADHVQRGAPPVFHNGLPLLEPPYAHLVALDLNGAAIKWRVPFGDQPRLREHPALAGVDLPARLGSPGNSGAIVTKGGLVFMGSGDTAMYAFDTGTGQELARVELPQPVQSTPMTYRARSGRQFVVVGIGRSSDTSLVALALK